MFWIGTRKGAFAFSYQESQTLERRRAALLANGVFDFRGRVSCS
jgi:hypothetical protein